MIDQVGGFPASFPRNRETRSPRAELGYPIMVTPFAQFVGSQAAINVIVGERYKEVTDQVIQYTLSKNPGSAPRARDRRNRIP